MNRLTSGTVSLLALLFAVSCNTEPTEDLRNGIDKLVASPSQLFLELGRSKTVEVGAVDGQGNPLVFAYEVTSVGSGITVRRDSTFLPIFIDDTTLAAPATGPRFRFIVTSTAYAATSFTVSAGGEDLVIPVQVIPETAIAATFSNLTPALGDTITLTAPAGVTFTQTAVLQIPGVADSLNPFIVERDPAGAFIKFLAPPNVNSPITVTEVVAAAAPSVILSPTTIDRLSTPRIDSVDVTFSATSPALGQTVTATIDNPLIKFRPDVVINFPEQLPGSASGPGAVTVAADSASLTFEAPPNANGSASVVSFVFPGGFSLALPTRTGITAPNIGTTLNATFDDETPDALQAVTITAPAEFVFGPVDADSVTVGGDLAINQSVAVDGSSITVIPIPGSTGPAVIAGVRPSAAPQFILTLSTVATLTVPALTPLEGTDDPATAPELSIPSAGNSVTLNDAGTFDFDFAGFPTRLYKIVITAPTTLTFTVDWFQGQDLGLYIFTDPVDPGTIIDAADSFGEGPGGHPETVTIAFAPGTYYGGLLNFSASDPSFFQLNISNP